MKKSESRGKKAQAALEFLSTYGWAVLIIALVIVAIAWLGIFNVTGQVPDRCAFPLGSLTCGDARVTSTSGGFFPPPPPKNRLESLTVTNNFGKTVTLCFFSCSAEEPDPTTGLPPGVLNRKVSDCGGVFVSSTTLYSQQEKTIVSVGVVPPSLSLCKDAAGRDDSFAAGTRYAGKIYVQYFFPGDNPTSKLRVLSGDLVTTVQAS